MFSLRENIPGNFLYPRPLVNILCTPLTLRFIGFYAYGTAVRRYCNIPVLRSSRLGRGSGYFSPPHPQSDHTRSIFRSNTLKISDLLCFRVLYHTGLIYCTLFIFFIFILFTIYGFEVTKSVYLDDWKKGFHPNRIYEFILVFNSKFQFKVQFKMGV